MRALRMITRRAYCLLHRGGCEAVEDGAADLLRFVEYSAMFVGGSPRMRGLRRRRMLGWRAAHGSGGCRPPGPVARRASRGRSFPPRPPAKAYSALRTFSHAHGLSPPGDGVVRPPGSRATTLSVFHSSWLPNRPSRGGVAAGVSAERSEAANGGGGRQPPDPCAAREPRACAGSLQQTLRYLARTE